MSVDDISMVMFFFTHLKLSVTYDGQMNHVIRAFAIKKFKRARL